MTTHAHKLDAHPADPSRTADVAASDRLRAVVELAKPGIVRMVLVAAAVGFILGSIRTAATADAVVNAFAFFSTAALTLLGTALAAAGANALNMVMETHRDAKMRRTADRPIPAGRLQPREGLAAGLAFAISGCAVLAAGVSLGAAAVAATTVLTYLFLYTPLKPVTPWSTVVGAFPGALPPLVGWAAATTMQTGSQWGGLIEPGGWSLVALMFVWQVPHVMAISWRYKDQYLQGGYRVLPSIDPTGVRTAIAALAWSAALVPISLLPARLLPADTVGPVYLAIATLAGLAMCLASYRLLQQRSERAALVLFIVSIVYLPVVLFALVGDALLGELITAAVASLTA